MCGQLAQGCLDRVVGRERDAHRYWALHPIHTQPFEEAPRALRPAQQHSPITPQTKCKHVQIQYSIITAVRKPLAMILIFQR